MWLLTFPHESSRGFSLRLFGRSIQVIWMGILGLTVLSEIYPFPLIPPLPFYTIRCTKLLLFFLVGYVVPFGFWRFRSLGVGIIFAFASTVFIEVLQGWLGHGHALHWYEMLVKVILIFGGYCMGCGGVYKRLGTVDESVRGVDPEWLSERPRRSGGLRPDQVD
jgi:glycopeptide antibiotics resistance protein